MRFRLNERPITFDTEPASINTDWKSLHFEFTFIFDNANNANEVDKFAKVLKRLFADKYKDFYTNCYSIKGDSAGQYVMCAVRISNSDVCKDYVDSKQISNLAAESDVELSHFAHDWGIGPRYMWNDPDILKKYFPDIYAIWDSMQTTGINLYTQFNLDCLQCSDTSFTLEMEEDLNEI